MKDLCSCNDRLASCNLDKEAKGAEDAEKNSQEAYEIQFAAYKQFCNDTTVEKKRLIKEANEKIEVLKTDFAKYLSEYKEFSDLMAQILAAKFCKEQTEQVLPSQALQAST